MLYAYFPTPFGMVLPSNCNKVMKHTLNSQYKITIIWWSCKLGISTCTASSPMFIFSMIVTN